MASSCEVSSRARVVLPEPEQPAIPRMRGRVGKDIWIGSGMVLRGLRFDLGDEGFEEGGEVGLGLEAHLHDLFVVDGLIEDSGGEVGDEREAEDLQAHVAGDDDLVHGGHADEVGAEGAEGADLGGGLIGGAEDGEVDTFGQADVPAGGLLLGEVAEGGGVGVGHVEEALAGTRGDAEAGFVGPDGGVHAGEVDVVGDRDETALGQVGADAASGVGDDEGAAAEEAEDAGGEGHLGHGVALVGVDAALHDRDGDAVDVAEDELAGVSDDGGLGEVRDLGVGDRDLFLDAIGEVAEAGAEDDPDGGCVGAPLADVAGGVLGSFVDLVHVLLPGGAPPSPH